MPKNRILIESDVDDVAQVDKQLAETIDFVAKCSGWSSEAVVENTFTNTRAFLGLLKR